MPFAENIPAFYCYVREKFLYNGDTAKKGKIPCMVFAVDSVQGQAIGFDIMTDCGAQFARMPIHSLCHKEDAPERALNELELWNNLSYSVEAREYQALRNMRCTVLKTALAGTYLFTLSWQGSTWADNPGDGGFKRAHIIKLDEGNYAAQPNNRIVWEDPAFITKPFPEKPQFKTNTQVWDCETKWKTADNDFYYYDIESPI